MVYVRNSYLSRILSEKQRFHDGIPQFAPHGGGKTMLTVSGMNTEEIAYRTGYHSTKFFYRAVRAYTGMSTREYRNLEAADKASGT